MRRRAVALSATLAAVLLLAGGPARADTLLLDRFRDYLDSLRTQSAIPGLSAAIVGPSDILWERAFGRQDVERSIQTRTDTPFQADGLMEAVTATLALNCVEQGRLSLDDRIGQFRPDSPDAGSTVRQVLTHTTGTPENLVYTYRPDRLEPLARAIENCVESPFRLTVADLLDRLAMVDSVPGPDVVRLTPVDDGFPSPVALGRYAAVLGRLAVPYATDSKGRTTPALPTASTLTPTSGLVSTVHDLAQFDLALKHGLLLRAETLAAAWQAPVSRAGQKLPHAAGWFTQTYSGEFIAWQFGTSDVSSSMIITAPARGLTLILMANSSGLVKPFPLTAGDVSVSPFAKLFLQLFVR